MLDLFLIGNIITVYLMYKGPLGIGVDIVIRNDEGKVLLHQRSDDNTWSMIGGWVEKGETSDQAAVREAKEETGFDIILKCLAHVQIRPVGTVHLTYIAGNVRGALKVSNESTRVEFKTVEKVKNWHVDHKERIEKALHG